jgi:hypothetical protein
MPFPDSVAPATHPIAESVEMDRSISTVSSMLRRGGCSYAHIATVLRKTFPMSPLAAMRHAHGWSEMEAAAAWNELFPDEPQKASANFQYWEQWPGRDGYPPSLAALERLARLYRCAMSDLLDGLGDYRHLDPPPAPGSPIRGHALGHRE